MDGSASSTEGQPSGLWWTKGSVRQMGWRRSRIAPYLRLGTCFLSITVSIVLVGLFGKDNKAGNLIWVANGMLLAYLLLAPRWRWPAYLCAGFAGMTLGSWLIHETWQINVFYNVLDMTEVLFAALLLRSKSTQLPRFTEGPYLARFLLYAVVGGPVVAATLNAAAQAIYWHQAPLPFLLGWIRADGLGITVACPIFVAILPAGREASKRWRRDWIYLVLLAVLTVSVFAWSKWPTLFLIYPALILVLLRLGLGWAATSSLFVAFVGGWFTLQGRGPLAQSVALSAHDRGLLLQVFVAAGVFMLYSVSVVLESRRSMERRLEKIVALHTLVTENSRDAIILADFNGRRTYESAAVERIVGWPPREFARMKSLDLVHPEDIAGAEEKVRSLRDGAEGATIECRVRKYDGDYIWVEASLRIVRDAKTGAPSGVLNIVRDVTERKLVERKLQDAYRAVEALAATDALTGLANRRRFDEVLNSEWRRGLRDHRDLSLLMIDADYFKSYNDCYGHMRGDSCLRQIAEAAQDVVARPGDLVARFGGEEFAVILPNTDRTGAMQLAVEINEAMRGKGLPHKGNSAGIVTVSIGCATMAPAFGMHAVNLIEQADVALYRAKRNGRDQVCDGTEAGVQQLSADPGLGKSA